MFDTIQDKMKNVLDLYVEDSTESKEMKIALEKKMSFRFPANSTNLSEVQRSVKNLVNHISLVQLVIIL